MSRKTKATRAGRSLDRRWKIAAGSAWLGLLASLVLAARIVQVQTRPGESGLVIALLVSGVIVLPFVASVTAVIADSSTRTVALSVLAGVVVAGFVLGLVPWFVGVALLVVVAIRRRPPLGKAGQG